MRDQSDNYMAVAVSVTLVESVRACWWGPKQCSNNSKQNLFKSLSATHVDELALSKLRSNRVLQAGADESWELAIGKSSGALFTVEKGWGRVVPDGKTMRKTLNLSASTKKWTANYNLTRHSDNRKHRQKGQQRSRPIAKTEHGFLREVPRATSGFSFASFVLHETLQKWEKMTIGNLLHGTMYFWGSPTVHQFEMADRWRWKSHN